MTFPVFQEKIQSREVRNYFETLGLDVWDAWAFFKLLDTDRSGVVRTEEFFDGCLRFSGEASAVEVGTMAQDQRWLIRCQGRFQKMVEQELLRTRAMVSQLMEAMQSSAAVVRTEL